MPIITNSNNFFCEKHFVFIENDILLAKQDLHSPLSIEDLPGEQVLRRCLSCQIASDWYAEPELNYSALMLEQNAPIPAGCSTMPLRQFFWESKTREEQERGLPSALGGLAARAHSFLRLRQTYIFCPSCGTKLEVHKEQVAKVCPNCGRLDFPRIEPAIIVLVSRGDEVLLVKNKNRNQHFFSCVAGFVEQGETIEQCVAREVKEETNIDIQNIRYVGSQSWPFPDQLMLAFTAEYKCGEIKIQEEEIAEAGWFSRNKLPDIPKEGSVAYNLIKGLFGSGK